MEKSGVDGKGWRGEKGEGEGESGFSAVPIADVKSASTTSETREILFPAWRILLNMYLEHSKAAP